MHCMCKKCMSIYKIVFGVLLLLNAFVWPRWLGIDGWISFLAVLMILGGVLMMFPTMCPDCKGMCSTTPVKKGKKK